MRTSNIAGQLSAPKMTTIFVCERQTVDDIARLMLRGIKASTEQAHAVRWYFEGETAHETCRNVWQYLRENVTYIRENPNLQTVKTLSRLLLHDKHGDCKHLTTAACAILKACGIKCKMRLVSFKFYDTEPTHVYCVAYDEQGRQIFVDAVLNKFDNEPAYKHKTDIKC